ncbi:MAG: hypothetical protein J6X97_02280 [Lachnospiraceae bacterium]|nr:hypothetical protein [Lachnospiraceae bacterium]
MENTDVNKNKILAKVFHALTIVSGIVATLAILVNAIITIFFIIGFALAIILDAGSESSIDPNISYEVVSFKNDRLDLGERNDGYYYTIIRMVDPDFFVGNDGEYVVLKQYGSIPSVKYYHFTAERDQLSPYLVNAELSTDDLSDMIDSKVIAQNSEFFVDRTDYIYTVIDMESDILKTPEDYDREWFNGFLGLLIGFFSTIGALIALITKLFAFIVLVVFAVFLNQYCVKSKNIKTNLSK